MAKEQKQGVFVVMSYWYGTHDDEAVYGEVSKVERVVIGTQGRAEDVEREIENSIKDKSRFCYTEIVETSITE